jgi:hypothetical protein
MSTPSDRAIAAAKAVLAKCAANDPWFPQPAESTVLAWAEQITLTNMPKDLLLEAVTSVYASNGHGFKPLPADVINAARSIRRDRTEREDDEIRSQREAIIDSRIAEHVAEIAAAKTIPDEELKFQRPQNNALLVPCATCHASVGRRCTASDAKPLRRSLYHPQRLVAAAETRRGVDEPAGGVGR